MKKFWRTEGLGLLEQGPSVTGIVQLKLTGPMQLSSVGTYGVVRACNHQQFDKACVV